MLLQKSSNKLRQLHSWHFVTPNRLMTQKDLAAQTGLPLSRIGKIERGEARPTPEDLILLAGAFNLTQEERFEFFSLANGVPTSEVYRSITFPNNGKFTEESPTSQEELDRITNRLSAIRLPAFISDSFTDIVSYNDIMRYLYNWPDEILNDPLAHGIWPNIIFVLLCDELHMGDWVIDKAAWERIVISNVQFFRRASMEVRATDYWDLLFHQLHEHRKLGHEFMRYWVRAVWDHYMDGNIERQYWLRIPVEKTLQEIFGQEIVLKYMAITVGESTQFGRLYVTIYLPIDMQTSRYFEALTQKATWDGQRSIEFRSLYGMWPLEIKEKYICSKWPCNHA